MTDDKEFTDFCEDVLPRTGYSGPVRGEKPWRKKEVTIDEYHGCVVLSALACYSQQVQKEHNLLRLSRERNLMSEERAQLPSRMQALTREELADQIDSWGSLRISIEDWMEAFSFEKDPNAPPRVRSLSELP